MSDQRIVAVGLLTQQDFDVLGQDFKRCYRVRGVEGFEDLLAQLDEIEASPEGAARGLDETS